MAKRTDIRRFQEALAQKLAAAQQRSEGIAARWLGVMIGSQPVLLPLAATAGVIQEFTLTSVPFAPAHFAGVTNVRGELHDVIDLAPLLTEAASAPSSSARLVVLQPARTPRTALLVARVVGLRREESLAHRLAAPEASGIIARWREAGPNPIEWLEIDLAFWLKRAALLFQPAAELQP
ncbi:chemotaxis protein CheW [Hydrogenophilus thiooxidans]|uniref:chemotaxis protein CheW n=1 Tax=Hydrogenophilus thiooxidans TaxID=2820326 RepID=UPI001C2429BE|nr:chemotaxis protein CheW [Hydrogenophilus thiooxidans]